MKIKVIIDGKTKKLELSKPITILELAEKLNIVLPCFIVKVNGKIVPEDDEAMGTIEFVRITSGG